VVERVTAGHIARVVLPVRKEESLSRREAGERSGDACLAATTPGLSRKGDR
jgi:hypothetical protein